MVGALWPKSTAQLLFVPKSCYVKNFLQWPHPSKSWNKLILMQHASDVLLTHIKTWMYFGRLILAGVSICKYRSSNLVRKKKSLYVAEDNCTCFQHSKWPMAAQWSVDHTSSWGALLSNYLGKFVKVCHHPCIVFWKFLLVVRKKDHLVYILMMGLEYLTEGEGLSCRRWPHITTTLNMSTPIHGTRYVVWFCKGKTSVTPIGPSNTPSSLDPCNFQARRGKGSPTPHNKKSTVQIGIETSLRKVRGCLFVSFVI